MNVKIADLMAKRVITAQPHHTVEHVRGLLQRNRIHAIPVVGPDREPLGIVSTADLADDIKNGIPISHVMTKAVTTVPAYNEASAAARVMRKHRIHHVIVTHEKSVVGMVSSFDLLKLIDGQRFSAKAAPTPSRKKR